MITENHRNEQFFWPEKIRIAVCLTFDFQGGEHVKPMANGLMNLEDYAIGEYGPNTGVPRILDMLEEEGIKATFLTCGAIAERYPDRVKAIVSKGHEVAGHGYHHEVARQLKKEEESVVITKTQNMIKSVAGRPIQGWRSCTQSTNTIDLLFDQGFLWNSNSFSHDMPFLWERDGKVLVELPRHTFGDGRAYGHSESGNPDNAMTIWKAAFDELYDESISKARFLPFQIHPYISGRPGRTKALRSVIQYMKKADGVWFATGSEVANWCLNEVFEKKIAAPKILRVAGGA